MEKKPFIFNIALILLKIGVTAGLLFFLFRKVGFNGVIAYLETANPALVILAGLLLFSQIISSTLAWSGCVLFCWGPVSRMKLLRMTAIGLVLNQVLPASIGGIAGRTIMLTRQGVKLNASLASVFLERFTNLLSLSILGAIGFLAIFQTLSSDLAFNTMVNGGIAIFLLLVLLIFLRRNGITSYIPQFGFFSKIVRALKKIHQFVLDRPAFLAALAYGFSWNIASIIALYFLAAAAINDIAIIPFLAVASMCVMFAAIPISVAGWGVREGVMVALMPFAGISQEQALAISIVYGGVLALTRLPALPLFWLPRG